MFFLSSSVLYISLSVNNLKGNWILDGTPITSGSPVYVVYLFHTRDTHYPPTVDSDRFLVVQDGIIGWTMVTSNVG